MAEDERKEKKEQTAKVERRENTQDEEKCVCRGNQEQRREGETARKT